MLRNFSLVFPRVINICWGWKISVWISKNYPLVLELTNFSLDFQELSIFIGISLDFQELSTFVDVEKF